MAGVDDDENDDDNGVRGGDANGECDGKADAGEGGGVMANNCCPPCPCAIIATCKPSLSLPPTAYRLSAVPTVGIGGTAGIEQLCIRDGRGAGPAAVPSGFGFGVGVGFGFGLRVEGAVAVGGVRGVATRMVRRWHGGERGMSTPPLAPAAPAAPAAPPAAATGAAS